MKKILLTIFLTGFVLIATENPPDQFESVCTGGACSVETIKQHPLFQQKKSIFPREVLNPSSVINNTPQGTSDGLDSKNFIYDSNCQFGNCIGIPSGNTR